jgi:hypothetical protein
LSAAAGNLQGLASVDARSAQRIGLLDFSDRYPVFSGNREQRIAGKSNGQTLRLPIPVINYMKSCTIA